MPTVDDLRAFIREIWTAADVQRVIETSKAIPRYVWRDPSEIQAEADRIESYRQSLRDHLNGKVRKQRQDFGFHENPGPPPKPGTAGVLGAPTMQEWREKERRADLTASLLREGAIRWPNLGFPVSLEKMLEDPTLPDGIAALIESLRWREENLQASPAPHRVRRMMVNQPPRHHKRITRVVIDDLLTNDELRVAWDCGPGNDSTAVTLWSKHDDMIDLPPPWDPCWGPRGEEQ